MCGRDEHTGAKNYEPEACWEKNLGKSLTKDIDRYPLQRYHNSASLLLKERAYNRVS
jgi:hypothetical protein